tara:strand:+ start:143 stop:670 length:528 start_codon:yes stop_codon:yes gene_type:complete
MACLLTTGRKIPCKSGFGGIKTVYFADFGALTAVTVDATTKQVTALTGTPTWYEYDVKGPSSLETAVASSRDTGTTFYTQSLNLTLTFLDAKTQAELQILALGRPYVVVEDYYGNSFLCGFENGCELVSGTSVTGAAPGDLSGFTMVFEAMEETAPYFLDAGLITAAADQIDPTA